MGGISVIIPVYNQEKFLKECLDSVLVQTYKDLEIIAVNDGSTDGSLRILEEYAAKDERITVYNLSNGGYGRAMNYGMKKAEKEFIAILEPDDYIEADMYGKLIKYADGQDVIKGGYYEFSGNGDRKSYSFINKKCRNGYIKNDNLLFLEMSKYHPSIWSALYRREYLEKNNILFKEVPGAGWVDNPFYYEAMTLTDRVVIVEGSYYDYRTGETEASSNIKNPQMPLDRIKDILNDFEKRHCANDYIKLSAYFRAFYYISMIEKCESFQYENYKNEIKKILERFDKKVLSSYMSLYFIRYPQRKTYKKYTEKNYPMLTVFDIKGLCDLVKFVYRKFSM